MKLGALLFASGTLAHFDVFNTNIYELTARIKAGSLTSEQVVQTYIDRIHSMNGQLKAVLELNPDAIELARQADEKYKNGDVMPLLGIPILVKDNIATKDKMNTTAGSFALLGSKVCKDAEVVRRLREAGAIILGKTGMSEFAAMRGKTMSNGWSSRGGQVKSPHQHVIDVGGSSSGCGAGVAAGFAPVCLGTETYGSIISPSESNYIVGLKPEPGVTSREGVIPITLDEDTVGPMCIQVEDCKLVYDVIAEMPSSKPDRKLRVGYVSYSSSVWNDVIRTISKEAEVVDLTGKYPVPMMTVDLDQHLLCRFKEDMNDYLAALEISPVRTMEDIVKFNKDNAELVKLGTYDQFYLEQSLISPTYKRNKTFCDDLRTRYRAEGRAGETGIERIFDENKLDLYLDVPFAVITRSGFAGYPAIAIPTGANAGADISSQGAAATGKPGSEGMLLDVARIMKAYYVPKDPLMQ